MTTEFELLCQAAQPRPDLTRFRELLHKGIDHRSLAALAAAHGVRPALLDCLGEVSWETVPDAEKAALERFRQHHLTRTLMLAGELHGLATALSARSLPFVSFKGPTLALALYGGLARREYNDLDVIVPARHVDDAENAIASLGYASLQGDRRFRRAFLAPQRQYAFTRPDDGAAIDLHWDFSGAHAPFPLATDGLWDAPPLLTIGDRAIPVLSNADLALLLAGHGTKEGWAMLKWVSDFALLVDRYRDLDWMDLYLRARGRGCGEAVLLGCAVSNDLLGVALPEALARPIAASGRVRSRVASITGSMRANLPPPAQVEHFADLLLCDRQIDSIAGALKLAFTPTAGDYAAMKLPPALWGAYYVTRPCRLALKAALGRT